MSSLSAIIRSFMNREEHACHNCGVSRMEVTRDAEHQVMVLQVNSKPAIYWHMRDGGRIDVYAGQNFGEEEKEDIRRFMDEIPHVCQVKYLDDGRLAIDPSLFSRQSQFFSVTR